MRPHWAGIALIALLSCTGLVACSVRSPAPGMPAAHVQAIAITLTDATITASQSVLASEVPTVFVVANQGTVPHEFWLMPADLPQRMQQMPSPQWRSQLLYSTPAISPGMSDTFWYPVSVKMSQQSLAYGCYTADGQPVIVLPMRVSSEPSHLQQATLSRARLAASTPVDGEAAVP